MKFSNKEIEEIRVSLLEWYDEYKRDLPWRRLKDDDNGGEKKAYGVWVSEIMLQQTRVVTVIDYYNRWMKKWPSIHHLSMASLEVVFHLLLFWSFGLIVWKKVIFYEIGVVMIDD